METKNNFVYKFLPKVFLQLVFAKHFIEEIKQFDKTHFTG